MAWVFFHESVKEGKLPSPLAAAAALLAEPPPPPPAPIDTIGSRISPSLLLIIVIIAAIFFVSGLLHLLVRYLLNPPAAAAGGEPADGATGGGVTVFQGQLQQLFHLHDAGVDQSFIDALPIFHYKSIVGAAKDPFDCAVCLCEFEAEDELRLLPKCSHAFHSECIDTWLLSHSTCPLCRRCLLADFSPAASRCSSAVVLVRESGRSEQSLRESASERGESIRNLNFSLCGEDDSMSIITENQDKTAGKEEVSEAAETKVVTIKLGKFKSTVDAAGGGVQAQAHAGGNDGLDQRRCLSMGSSYEYVMEESTLLRVAIHATKKKPALMKVSCHRVAMSECDCHSRRILNFRVDDPNANASASASLRKKESFSVSKIWMQSRKDEPVAGEAVSASSRRAFSFRLPLRRAGREEPRQKKRPASEFDDLRWCKSGSELDLDLEDGSCNKKVDATPSFARTLVSLLGRQNKIGDHA